jgi:hypothetical protein
MSSRYSRSLGIDLNAVDQDGLTALDYTQSRGFMPFMALQTPLYKGVGRHLAGGRAGGARADLQARHRLAALFGSTMGPSPRRPMLRSGNWPALLTRLCADSGLHPLRGSKRLW